MFAAPSVALHCLGAANGTNGGTADGATTAGTTHFTDFGCHVDRQVVARQTLETLNPKPVNTPSPRPPANVYAEA